MAMPKAKELASSNPVVVFSKSYCPYCVKVKKLLQQLGVTFKAIELDFEETVAMHEEGKLVPLITQAGAVATASA